MFFNKKPEVTANAKPIGKFTKAKGKSVSSKQESGASGLQKVTITA